MVRVKEVEVVKDLRQQGCSDYIAIKSINCQ